MTVGDHLLGRVPSPADERDWQLAGFLSGDPLDAALAALQKSRAAKATKLWAAIASERIKASSPYVEPPAPPPAPIPAPPVADVVWGDVRAVLNQSDTPHCVGFGWAQWGNSDPVEDDYVDTDGHALYYECKAIDGESGRENGSNVRSGAQAMQARKRLDAYAFAATVDEVRAWVTGHGPIVFGTDWLHDMFSPAADGTVSVTGAVDGGHCYLGVGYHEGRDAFECLNSWGDAWGVRGRFFIPTAGLAQLLAQQGEACAALELML